MTPVGILYIVATPIGNLEDITIRAVRTLKEVDLIAAEDTRHTRKLLNHYKIATPLTSYFEHNKLTKGDFILARLREGKNVALVSDAGTPGISDPGFDLIKSAAETGARIVPVPGASAVVAALSISAISTSRFAFEGFLPPKEKARRDRLLSLRQETRTMVFYESPQRLPSTLMDIRDTIGDRNIVVTREMTKIFEEVMRGKVSEIISGLGPQAIKGEIVIVLEGFQGELFKGSIQDELSNALRDGLSMKEAVDAVAKGHNLSKGEVYKEGLRLKRDHS